MDEDSPKWIGAWWIGCVLVGAWLLLLAPFMTLFPAVIPSPETRNTDAQKVQKELAAEKTPSNIKEWLDEVKAVIQRLVRNKIYVFHVLATTLILAAIIGFATFLPKYFEFVFRQRASTSGIVGPAAKSGASVIGFLLAGFLVGKFQPRPRK